MGFVTSPVETSSGVEFQPYEIAAREIVPNAGCAVLPVTKLEKFMCLAEGETIVTIPIG